MYMRAVTVRIVYVGIVSLGILLSAAFRESTVQAAPVAAHPSAASLAAKSAAPVTTLATVHVTASAAAAAKAPLQRRGATVPPDLSSEASADIRGLSALPSLRLDMPYYSFGKMLPRVGKE